MYIHNPQWKRLYRILFLFCCEMGMVLQYALTARMGNIHMLACYYTVLTNMLCFVYFAYLLVRQPEEENPTFQGLVVLGIALTGLGYHLLLNGAMEAGVGAAREVTLTDIAANTMLHTVVPLGTFLDYLLFSPKGRYTWKMPFVWLLPAFLYSIFIFIRAQISTATFAGFSGKSLYPYPFMDVDLYGWGVILPVILLMFVGLIGLGFLLYGLDHLLAKGKKA